MDLHPTVVMHLQILPPEGRRTQQREHRPSHWEKVGLCGSLNAQRLDLWTGKGQASRLGA